MTEQTATKKLAQAIASTIRDCDKLSPAAQMDAYFAIGRKLQAVVEDEGKYGTAAMMQIAALVPELKDEGRAYEILNISKVTRAARKFILEQTAIPMANGQYLTLGHWLWLMRHADRADQGEWLCRELAWLRSESPSAAMIEHVEGVSEERYGRERETFQDRVEEAFRLLNAY